MSHRLALTINGLYMVYKTAGRGVGAAGFEDNISSEDLLVPLPILRFGARWNAHNFWVEILSQYGVLPFGAFMAVLGWAGLLGWRAQRRPPGELSSGGGAQRDRGIGRLRVLWRGRGHSHGATDELDVLGQPHRASRFPPR